MGYLDHSTNNIILDAVLTDYGRSKLAAGGNASGNATNQGGSFVISKFALGDDEVDYTMIKKYGRTVGKEKIEKNTPIFEALTNENIALKYKLAGLSSSGATLRSQYFPIIEKVAPSNANIDASNQQTNTTVSFRLKYRDQTASSTQLISDFGSELRNYTLEVSSRFLIPEAGSGVGPLSESPSSSGQDVNRTKRWNLTTTAYDFTLRFTAQSIDSTTLSIYGKTISGKKVITTYATLTNELGIRYSFPITYTRSP